MKLVKLLALISPPASTLALNSLLLLLASAVSLANPWVAGQLTGHILGSDNLFFSSFIHLLLAWMALMAVRSLLSFATGYATGSAAEGVLAGLRSRLYEHMQRLPVSYYDEQRRGAVLSVLSNDAAIVSNFVSGTLVQVLPLLLTFVGAAALMVWINPVISAATLVLIPVYVLTMKLIGRRIRPLSKRWVEAYGDMLTMVEENLGLLPAIKSYTREAQESEKFARVNDHLLGLSRKSLFIHTLIPPFISLLASLGLLTLIWLGYREISSGSLAPEQLVSLLLYAMLLNQPLSQLASVYGQLQNTRGASERILTFLDQEPEPLNDTPEKLRVSEGRIDIHNLAFAYGGTKKPLFECLNLTIQGGESIAIVGNNGEGKSTLAHLLMRLIDPDAGHIAIDGTDIRTVSINSVRANIGLVAQHTLLLNASVRENIAWGKALASDADIEAAAKAARAHDFITGLSSGYDTIIGDQGVKLSGGQRQRLALARALIKDPPILILDEATSMFDPAGEVEFLRDCKRIFDRRTVILITHRPASLAVADRVFCLREGRLERVADVGEYLKFGVI